MNAERVFVDTNVLTYVFDDAEPVKQARARELLASEARELVVSTQVLQELYVSLTKGRHPIAAPDIAERAVRGASGYTVVQLDVDLVLTGIDVAQKRQLSFWDALILAAAARARCGALLSEDLNTGQVIEGVRVENPFL